MGQAPLQPASQSEPAQKRADPESASRKSKQLLGSKFFSRNNDNVNNIDSLNQMLDLNKAAIGDSFHGFDKFATGTVFGICSGYAARKAFRLSALVLGAGFISLQLLQYHGYVTIEWQLIEKELTNCLDLNKDGQLDSKDIALAKEQMMKILTWGLPCASGFGTGFILGLRGHVI